MGASPPTPYAQAAMSPSLEARKPKRVRKAVKRFEAIPASGNRKSVSASRSRERKKPEEEAYAMDTDDFVSDEDNEQTPPRKSPFVGAFFGWQAQVYHHGTIRLLGSYATKSAATQAWDFAILNRFTIDVSAHSENRRQGGATDPSLGPANMSASPPSPYAQAAMYDSSPAPQMVNTQQLWLPLCARLLHRFVFTTRLPLLRALLHRRRRPRGRT